MSQHEDKSEETGATGNPSSKEGSPSQNPKQDLVPAERYSLTPANPIIVGLSRAFHWTPATAITRIEQALPDKFEQQVYLGVAESFRIHPESLAKLLRLYRGSKPLSVHDLERRPMGQNVVSNSFGDFSDFFEACMNLVKVVAKEFEAFSINMEFAARIVLAYGPNNPEQVIEMIDANLDECCDFFGISKYRGYGARLRICTWYFVDRLLPELMNRGVPNVLDPDEFIGDRALQRYCLGEESASERRDPDFERQLHDLLHGGGVS